MSKVHDHYAYPHDPEIEAVMRFGSVKRWHMLDTTKTQTLAEHSGNVALLAHLIAYNAPGMFFGPSLEAAMFGLLHDVSEVFTGDIPTPTKRHLVGLKAIEDKVLPYTFRWQASDDIKMMVKICDLADGIRFIRLHGVGVTGRHATEGLIEQFDILVADAITKWPPEVLSHVVEKAWFYAHETGVTDAPGPEVPDGGPVAADLARGQGDNAGGTGFELRDALTGVTEIMRGAGAIIEITNPSYAEWLRNRVVGTEGSEPFQSSNWKPGLSD